jgi:hypothetical protein
LNRDGVVQRNLLTTVTGVYLVILSTVFGGSVWYRTWGSDCRSRIARRSGCYAGNCGRRILSSGWADTDVCIVDEVRTIHVDCRVVADQLGESGAMSGRHSRTIICCFY